MPQPPPSTKRKKWTEEEERTLIDKYEELQSDGTLARARTRQHKFRPIADAVNSAHHSADPSAFPFLWSWKDACTKAQNMRHQFLLVKRKLLSARSPEIHWADGASLWPNFLRYKAVFGDHPLPSKPSTAPPPADAGDDVAVEEVGPSTEPVSTVRRRRGVRGEEGEEGRAEVRRREWRKRVEGMVARHRAEMEQIQARLVSEQQAMMSQILGIGVQQQHADVPQMVQSFVQHQQQDQDGRAGAGGREDQFIVDG